MFNRLSLFAALILTQTLYAQQPCEKLAGLKQASMEVTSAVLASRGTGFYRNGQSADQYTRPLRRNGHRASGRRL